jgi:hypothetical protein
MSINIPAETPDESTNPISVEEFERLHPAMLGAIRKAVREELELSLARSEEHGDSEDGSRDFKRTVLSSSSVQHTLDKHRNHHR